MLIKNGLIIMKIDDIFENNTWDNVKSSAKKFWHGTSGEISRERRWPVAYEKAKVAYQQALSSGDFEAIDKYSDLVNYFGLLTGKPTLDSFQNRLLRQKWTKQDFVNYVKQQYPDDLARASSGQMEETISEAKKDKAVWDKPNPKKKHKKLTAKQKAKAKARAKKAGREYPNMVDNIWAARLNEQTENKQKVIIKLDPANPMDDSMIATLGGAGSWSFKGLRDKARREAEELTKRLQSDHPLAFRDSAYNIRQLANTLNTIITAYNELNEIRSKGGVKSRGINPSESKFNEQNDNKIPLPPSRAEIEKDKQELKQRHASAAAWEERERNRGKSSGRGRSHAVMLHEITRQFPDADGNFFEIEVELSISGVYNKGYRGSQYEPAEPAHYDDIYLEWAEPIEQDPEGGPLTMKEKIDIEMWFDSRDGQDYAHEALAEQND